MVETAKKRQIQLNVSGLLTRHFCLLALPANLLTIETGNLLFDKDNFLWNDLRCQLDTLLRVHVKVYLSSVFSLDTSSVIESVIERPPLCDIEFCGLVQ